MYNKSSRNYINANRFPEEILDIITEACKQTTDPYYSLIFWAYVFLGLKISEICDLIIITERTNVRHPSREYIRQRIIYMFKLINTIYLEKYGKDTTVSLIHNNNDSDYQVQISDIYKDIIIHKEDHDENSGEKQEHRKCFPKRRKLQNSSLVKKDKWE